MPKNTRAPLVPVEHIARSILILRGHRVVLDRDLAAIYGVSTGRLNEAVKRNARRFPEDFMFQLTAEESEINRDRAIEMSVYVVRAFVKLRELLASNADLARRLDELEARIILGRV